ncbi:MAG: hypothetical protein DRN30_02955 [Thermoplasmata archaeon]|nr:HAD family hydrolase [Euryarchaeota archaeon]RLF65992.1 MAG: hypothetical protein DRN30_02955 [Thermoplasmata archaeon]
MVKVVCFDVWGTLLNIEEFYVEVSKHISSIIGRDLKSTIEELIQAYNKTKEMRRQGLFDNKKIIEQSLQVMSNETGIPIEVLRRSMARATYSIAPEKALMEGALEVAKEVKELGLNTAILGNVLFWPGSFTRIIIERTGLGDYIDVQFYADEIGTSKPQKEAFTLVMRYFNLNNPKELMHVGDSIYEDFSGALGSRAVGVLIDPKVKNVIIIGNHEAYVIPKISDLLKIIKKK